MDTSSKIYWKNWPTAIIVIVCLFLLSVVANYLGPTSYAKAYLKVLPLPAAFVSGHSVGLRDVYRRMEIVGHIQNPPTEKEVLNKMISEKKVALLTAQKGIKVSQDEINTESARLGATDSQLSSFGIDNQYYKNNIVLPTILERKLAVWLASQENLNADAYKKVKSAEFDLKSGIAFEDVAQKYSDDTLNAKVGGDIGFVGERDIFPEIYDAAAAIKDHDMHVVPSRLGVHLLQVLDTDSNGPDQSARYHIRQIFIKTQDFSSWLEQQNLSTIKLL